MKVAAARRQQLQFELGLHSRLSYRLFLLRGASMWWAYAIECARSRIYVGISNDLPHRISLHWRGAAALFTKLNPPKKFLGAIALPSRSVAVRVERALKRTPSSEKRRLFHDAEVRGGVSRLVVGLRENDGRETVVKALCYTKLAEIERAEAAQADP